jgi:HD superfamily phosphohydrolase YqeK
VLPLTDGSLRAAEKLSSRYELELPDATMFAAILHDLRRGGPESCFLNRNTSDFSKPALVRLLEQYACKMLGNFDNGLAYMRNRIAADPG